MAQLHLGQSTTAFTSNVGRELWIAEHSVTACDAGPIPSMIGAELFRQGPRPKAMAVAGAVNWVGTFVIALCYEYAAVSKTIQLYYCCCM